jgi:uncharacterized delta-60 repeat protein
MLSLFPPTCVAPLTSWARATVRAGKAALFVFSFVLLLAGGAPAVRGQSALDGFDPNANGNVNVVVVQRDGKILLGGAFTTLAPNGGPAVTRNHIARLNPDGTLDTGFNPNSDNTVDAIAVQADDKILVGGWFDSIGRQTRHRVARLDSATGLADSFDPNVGAALINSIAIQADGKILVAGDLVSSGGEKRNGIARIDPATGQTDSFNPNANSAVNSIVIQPDGKILAAGSFTEIGGQVRSGLARLDPITGLADSFNPNARNNLLSGVVGAIAVQADGKILASGNFVEIGGQTRFYMARLDPVTGLADSFNPKASSFVEAITVQADGKILVGGIFTNIGGRVRRYIARLDPNTGLADSFDPSAGDFVTAIAVQADGKVLAAGWFTALAPHDGETVTRNHIARLETDGRLDQTLDLGIPGNGFVMAAAVQPDGKILIGGSFATVLGVARNNIARLNPDGTLDTAFDPNANTPNCLVSAITVQADGKILVGGTFTSIGGQTRNRIARLDATTGLADSFNPVANSFVNAIAVQADGKILVGGLFTGTSSIGGQARNRLARLDPTTGLADSFDPNANNEVDSIAVQADGKILVGGRFNGANSIGGQTRNHIARLDATTGLADSFDPNANNDVLSIAVPGNGKILAGGTFTNIGGQTRNYIARLDPTTGLADSFDPNANSFVSSIAVQADGKILAGGQFGIIGGQMRHSIARLDATTGLPDSFNPNVSDTVYSIAVQADGKILAGGPFTGIDGRARNLFGRLSNDTAALQHLAVSPTTVTWTRNGSSPDLMHVTFESSTDNAIYTPLGNGTAAGSNWSLTGVSLPKGQNFYVRARGYYRCGYENASENITESVRNAFLAPAAQALNLSTRMRVGIGDNAGIGGFIIAGSAPKHVLLRAMTGLYVKFDMLVDPVLELHGPGAFVTIINDNWRDDPLQAAAILATGLAPNHDLESAIDATLDPGPYTAVVRGKNNTPGIGLIEVYDLSGDVPAKLANISTRAFVGTGGTIIVAGFILGGHSGDDRIVARGIGPSLTALGVPNALANPRMELRDSNAMLRMANNDWQDDPAQAAELTASGLAPANNLEAAMAATLPPGAYTVLVFGDNNGTGVGLVEVYDRGAP